MSQHDMNLADQNGAAFRADLNNALAALVTNSSGATEPATMFAYQPWADTTSGLMKQRNAANSAWITIGTLAEVGLGLLSRTGGNMTGGINGAESTVASNTTPDIFATTVGGLIDYTGTATCTGFVAAPQAGAERTLVCAAAAVFTAGANMLIDGVTSGNNFASAAGDKIIVRAVSATQFRLTPQKYDGTGVVAKEALVIAVSDEATAITTGTAKVTFRMPYAMTLTEIPRANLNTASSSGLPTVDINKAGISILSTKITIDASEKTSTTAATPAVLSDTALDDDADMTIDIDVAGTGAKGLKVTLIGRRT